MFVNCICRRFEVNTYNCVVVCTRIRNVVRTMRVDLSSLICMPTILFPTTLHRNYVPFCNLLKVPAFVWRLASVNPLKCSSVTVTLKIIASLTNMVHRYWSKVSHMPFAITTYFTGRFCSANECMPDFAYI